MPKANSAIRGPWRRLLGLLKLERKDIVQIAYYAIFQGVIGLSLPLGIQAIINLMQGAQVSVSWVVLVVLVTIGVILYGVLQIMQMRIIETIQQRIFTRASFDLVYRFPKIRTSVLDNLYLPELANRFFDTLTIQKGLSKLLIDVPTAVLQIIFALILLSFYHPFFIIFGFILLLLIYMVYKYTINIGIETSLVESKYKYKVAHWLEEVARSVIGFKISGKSNLALKKNDKLVKSYIDARESHFKVLVIQLIQMISFKVLITAGLLVIGGLLVINQQMNLGQFVAAEIIIILVMNSVEKLTAGLEVFYDVLTSIEKLGQIVDKPIESQKGEKPDLTTLNIEFNNVSYSFKNTRDVINDVNFSIGQRERIIIRGKSGAGKSTLLRLIAGIIAPTQGSININSLALSSLSINHYRSHLGIVLTDQTPFEGTIRDNIVFGQPDLSDEQIIKVFEDIKLIDFLKAQPDGLNTILYPEGKQIPHTIAKKIILARAIINDPKLLILEEPFNQFDPSQAKEIIDFLTDKKRNWSLVVVDQNSYWDQSCSTVMELEKGYLKN